MRSVLVLNGNADFWDEIGVRKAVIKLLKQKATLLAHNGKLLGRTPEGEPIWLPLIIQLRKYYRYKYKSHKVPYSHSAVYYRDDNYCQYWHYYKLIKDSMVPLEQPVRYRCTEEDRTIDHVIPTSQGGRSTFENTCCACRYCNLILKRDRTPREAGMKLITKPRTPIRVPGEYVQRKFVFNPKKESHREYIKLRYHGQWN